MKLKNKKTGEIKDLLWVINHLENDKDTFTLAELNEEWEDYEEPKGIQCIYYVNHFDAAKIDGVIVGFGNKEEAEKAVEKLKAWKRLKDKGFTFEGLDKPNYGEKFIIECSLPKETLAIDVAEDLDLLFGGEE